VEALQAVTQRRLLEPRLSGSPFPTWIRRLPRIPILRDVLARLIAIGVWPVHVRT
jgi:hypothetical protein